MIASLFLSVAIVAHEPGYYTSLANHVGRWLKDQDIAAEVVKPADMRTKLAKEKIAFLVGFESPSADEIKTLRSFRDRGGKLVVFYSASPQLGELLGVRPAGYKAASYPGQWSRMNFTGTAPPGAPTAILQTSSVLQRAVPIQGKSQVMATWVDRNGKSTGDAAWLSSPYGWWMTHVLLADGDESLKARLCASLVGSADPSLWSPARAAAKADAEFKSLRAYAAKQKPSRGEIHAVWDHSGCGLYPGNWPKTMKLLRESHVTDLFVNVAGAGFAHYASDVLPRSKTFREEGDQLAACLAAARGSGIRVHAWILCFTATRASPETVAAFDRNGWRLKAANGKTTEYLDPANALVRSRIFASIDEIQRRYSVDGIHLDFVRWGDSAVKPKNAADVISRFVADARRHVKRPRWLTTAVYGKHPQCIGSVGQDWKGWLDANLVDYVVPMDYTESKVTFQTLLAIQADSRSHARRTIIGIGVTANESRLDARDVIDQVNMTRRYGFAGNALFDLDTTLEKRILPFLRLGLW